MTLTSKVMLGVIHVHVLIKFHDPRSNRFQDMNYCPVTFGQVTDGQTEHDAYEPTVHGAQVGSKIYTRALPLSRGSSHWV